MLSQNHNDVNVVGLRLHGDITAVDDDCQSRSGFSDFVHVPNQPRRKLQPAVRFLNTSESFDNFFQRARMNAFGQNAINEIRYQGEFSLVRWRGGAGGRALDALRIPVRREDGAESWSSGRQEIERANETRKRREIVAESRMKS